MSTKFIGIMVVIYIFLGFFQEYSKVNINYHLETGSSLPDYFNQSAEKRKELLDAQKQYAPFDYYYSHAPLDVLHLFSRKQLVGLKWVVTLFFIVTYYLLNKMVIEKVCKSQEAITLHLIFGIGLFLFSLGVFALGKLLGQPDAAYAVSRKIAGFLQSPLPIAT
jgi:hypothetical protein